ncbi:hypothetical protein GGE12_004096 [Rhizobium mongolense]|uniref:Uncharacterized protein n=1 Tax=Rhizobium mongolense TaxID=57676 RepID=A0A7W6RPS8_9HYPH|nr:hypothetical protein [Rhizobium mongolense]
MSSSAVQTSKQRRDLFGYTVEELRELIHAGDSTALSSRTAMADVKQRLDGALIFLLNGTDRDHDRVNDPRRRTPDRNLTCR